MAWAPLKLEIRETRAATKKPSASADATVDESPDTPKQARRWHDGTPHRPDTRIAPGSAAAAVTVRRQVEGLTRQLHPGFDGAVE
jgi:hypothetical protein